MTQRIASLLRWLGRRFGRGGAVCPVAVRAPLLFQVGFEDMASASRKMLAHQGFNVAKASVVAVVVVFDDLKTPPAWQHVATDQLRADVLGHLWVARLAYQANGVVEQQVGTAGELVKGIEVAARSLGCLQRLRQLARGTHRCVVGAVGTPACSAAS